MWCTYPYSCGVMVYKSKPAVHLYRALCSNVWIIIIFHARKRKTSKQWILLCQWSKAQAYNLQNRIHIYIYTYVDLSQLSRRQILRTAKTSGERKIKHAPDWARSMQTFSVPVDWSFASQRICSSLCNNTNKAMQARHAYGLQFILFDADKLAVYLLFQSCFCYNVIIK